MTEEEELKGQIRSLEQHELSQMRQGAILQCKVEEAEMRHKELQRDLEARRAQVLQDQQEEEMRREQEAMVHLEENLQKRLEELRVRELEVEQSMRSEQQRKTYLEEEVHYWRSCGQALVKRAGGETAPPVERNKEASKHEAELTMEIKAMEVQGSELRLRIKEMERMVAMSRAQEVDLMTKNQTLQQSLALAQQAFAASQAKAASLQVELQKVEAVKPAVSPEAVEEGLSHDEVEYWRRLGFLSKPGRKKQEKTLEVDRLSREQQRLKALLLRSGATTDVSEYLSTRGCGTLDETISWFATSLFKSAFICRAFCVHLFVLYSWNVFLLRGISSRTH